MEPRDLRKTRPVDKKRRALNLLLVVVGWTALVVGLGAQALVVKITLLMIARATPRVFNTAPMARVDALL